VVFANLNALGLAMELAGLAVLALVVVNDRTEHGKAGEEAQRGAHGADIVAIGAAAPESQNPHHDQRDKGYNQGGKAAEPYLLVIEGIASSPFREAGQQVVAPNIDRLQKVLDHTAVSTVRGQKGDEYMDTGHKGYHIQGPHPIADSLHSLSVLERLFAAMGPKPGNAVLEDAQRADDRTIHAAENQGKQHKGHDYPHIQGQYGREELDFGHPTQIAMQRPCEIQKKEGDPYPENPGQRHSKFLKHNPLSLLCIKVNKYSFKYAKGFR
jgi:hypothetical protein